MTPTPRPMPGSFHPLRSSRGHPDIPRAINNDQLQARLARRLTPRDRWLIRMLHEHKVLTSTQITTAVFPSPRSANIRLLELYRWRVVDRFQPFLPVGSAPMHYVLDTAGVTVLAGILGVTPREIGYRHDRAISVMHHQHLAHDVARNGLFLDLIALARHSADTERLEAWWSATRCARVFRNIACPDAYARWVEGHRQVAFFLEYDTGTENLTQLTAKLTGYHTLAHATGQQIPILFWFLTPRREAAARRALTAALPNGVRIATTAGATPTPDGGPGTPVPDSPAGARWLPLAGVAGRVGTERLRLATLGQLWPAGPDPSFAMADDNRLIPAVAPDPMPPAPSGPAMTAWAG